MDNIVYIQFTNRTVIFKNSAENEVESIEYKGDMDSSIKDMKIANQGGLVVFRYVIEDLGNYTSNEDGEINHNELLKKLAINNDDLKFNVSFDININLDSNKSYKANVNLKLPIGNVVDDGIQSKENTDSEKVRMSIYVKKDSKRIIEGYAKAKNTSVSKILTDILDEFAQKNQAYANEYFALQDKIKAMTAEFNNKMAQ